MQPSSTFLSALLTLVHIHLASAETPTISPISTVFLPLPGPSVRPTAVSSPPPSIPTTFSPNYFASILSITNCPTSITPSATSLIDVDGTTTSFLSVGCGSSTILQGLGTRQPQNCYAGYGYAARAYVEICCPTGGWTSTTLGPAQSGMPNVYCASSVADAASTTDASTTRTKKTQSLASASDPTGPIVTLQSQTVPAKVRRQGGVGSPVSAPLTDSATSGDVATSTPVSATATDIQSTVVINDVLFAKAFTSTVVSGSSSSSGSGGGIGIPITAPTSTGSVSTITTDTAASTSASSVAASTTSAVGTSAAASTTAAGSGSSAVSAVSSAASSAVASVTPNSGAEKTEAAVVGMLIVALLAIVAL